MSNANDPHPDALNALENLGGGTPPADAPARNESVDASGFVSMLARGTQGEADPAGPSAPPPAMQRPMPQVSPKAQPAAAPRVNPLSAAIPVAKEIVRPAVEETPADAEAAAPEETAAEEEMPMEDEPAPAPVAAPRARVASRRTQQRRVPTWYRTAVPISFTVGSLLFLVGAWAVLAVIANYSKSDFCPGFKPGEDGVAMPLVLLLSLPVSIALAIMGVIMATHLKRQDAADDAAENG